MRTATAVPDWLARLTGTPDDRIAIKPVAAACGVHEMTVRTWAKAGKIDVVKVGLRVYVTRESLERFSRASPRR